MESRRWEERQGSDLSQLPRLSVDWEVLGTWQSDEDSKVDWGQVLLARALSLRNVPDIREPSCTSPLHLHPEAIGRVSHELLRLLALSCSA